MNQLLEDYDSVEKSYIASKYVKNLIDNEGIKILLN